MWQEKMEEQIPYSMVSADKHSHVLSSWHHSTPGCKKHAGLLPDAMPPPVTTDVQDFVMLGLNPSLRDACTIPLLLL